MKRKTIYDRKSLFPEKHYMWMIEWMYGTMKPFIYQVLNKIQWKVLNSLLAFYQLWKWYEVLNDKWYMMT